MKTKNLNEEINRMKLLMGESLLYGNMVNNTLLLEQKTKFFREIIDRIGKELKPGAIQTFKVRKGSAEDAIVIKKNDVGNLEIYRGDKLLGASDEISFDKLLSSLGKRELNKLTAPLSNKQAVRKFFSENGDYYNSLEVIYNDLVSQGIPIDRTFIQEAKNNDLGKQLYDKMYGSDFFTDVKSMSDIEKVHKNWVSYIDDIPELRNRLDDVFKKEYPDKYFDSDVVDLTRGLNSLRLKQINGEIDNFHIDWDPKSNDKIMRITIDEKYANDIPELKGANVVIKKGDASIDPYYNQPSFGENLVTYEIDVSKLNDQSFNFLKGDLENNIKFQDYQAPEGVKIKDTEGSTKMTGREKSEDFLSPKSVEDLSAQVDNVGRQFLEDTKYNDILRRIKRFFSGKDVVDIYEPTFLRRKFDEWWLTQKNIAKTNGMKAIDYAAVVFDNPKFSIKKNFKELWSKKFRESFDVNKWIKEGRGTKNVSSIDSKLKLTDLEEKYVTDLYVRKDGAEGGPFVVKSDLVDANGQPTTLAGKGYVEGMIHPDIELKSGWRKELYHLLWGDNAQKYANVIQALSPKIAKGSYNSWKKSVGRTIKVWMAWGFTDLTFTKWLPAVYAQWIMSRVVLQGSMNTINNLLSKRTDIKQIEAARYRDNCAAALVDGIQNSNLSEKLKGEIFEKEIQTKTIKDDQGNEKPQRITKEGVLISSGAIHEIGVVTFEEGAITGDVPQISATEIWNPIPEGGWIDAITDWGSSDWLAVDPNNPVKFDASKIKYPIDTFNATGDNWKIVNGELSITVKNDLSDWCVGVTEDSCKTLTISLKCKQKFPEWYKENKLDYDEVLEQLQDMALGALWDLYTSDGELWDKVMKKAEEMTKKTVEDTVNALDFDDSGAVTTDDVVQGAEKGWDKTQKVVTGQEKSTIGADGASNARDKFKKN